MTHAITSCPPVAARRPRLLSYVTAAFAAYRQRRALDNLDAHLRYDLGLDPEALRREADRPIWDVPKSWRL